MESCCRYIPSCLTSGIHEGNFSLAKWTVAVTESLCFCLLCGVFDRLENTQKNVEDQILWHRSKNACSWKETRSVSPESQHSTAPGHQKDSSEGEWKKVTSVKTFHLGHSKLPASLVNLGAFLNLRALQFSYSQNRVNNSGTAVMVNFMCQLTGLRDVQMAGKQDLWVWQ